MYISQEVKDNIDLYNQSFQTAKPFKHVLIDGFWKTEIAEELLKDFPNFDPQKAINEMGEVGGKAVYENLSEISTNYASIAKYISSEEFLEIISKITAIENLIHDDSFYGGGTHENLNGQELDPHIDFNFDERTGLHRRFNLIIFLNKEWDPSWGGSIELHSNPREPEVNEIKSFSPIFNRCVLFETNEYSWHGFPKIQLPEEKQHLSRKSLSIYLYTKERPELEIAPSHGTFYVQRPLPSHIKPGSVLSTEDYQEISWLLKKRDLFINFYQQKELKDSGILKKRDKIIQFYQQKELKDSAELQNLISYIKFLESRTRLPTTGYVLQEGVATGFWADGWCTQELNGNFRVQKGVNSIEIVGYISEQHLKPNIITVTVNDISSTKEITNTGTFTIEIAVQVDEGNLANISIANTETMSGLRANINEDIRETSFLLKEIRFIHHDSLGEEKSKLIPRTQLAKFQKAWLKVKQAAKLPQ